MYKKIKIKKIKKLPLIIAEHAFLTCLALFLLSLILGFILFYIYISLAQKAGLGDLESPRPLGQTTYQKVLETWQENERISQQVDSKEYPDPFLESVPFPE